MSDYIHENVLMRIIGDHPHADDLCHPIGKLPGSVSESNLFGEPTYRMKLINCFHGGVDSCFAGKSNLELIRIAEIKNE